MPIFDFTCHRCGKKLDVQSYERNFCDECIEYRAGAVEKALDKLSTSKGNDINKKAPYRYRVRSRAIFDKHCDLKGEMTPSLYSFSTFESLENFENYERFLPKDFNKEGEGRKRGCFISSACTIAYGLSDNCEQLKVLRAFRDGYLSRRIGGSEDIRNYYAVAPLIIDTIENREDAFRIYKGIYDSQIKKAVSLIQNGDYEEAYNLYKNMVNKLQNEFLKR